jgi:hypothetical protein
VPVVEDEPCLVAADRDGLRREAIAECIVVAGSGIPIVMLIASGRHAIGGGCGNQVARPGGRPSRPPHPPFPSCPSGGGEMWRHFSCADVNSGSSP